MTNTNPVTLPQGTTPGNGAAVPATPSAVTPPTTNPGAEGRSEGTVTIPTKEYAELQRAKARTLSFEKRQEFARKNAGTQTTNDGDPNTEALRVEQDARKESDRRALKAEVTLKVRDLLDKEEFKALPASTKAMILRNPAMLSEANNIEEALLDIEDFVRDQVIPLDRTSQPGDGSGAGRATPTDTHEVPPVNGGGSPSPARPTEFEDTSKLTGPARSRAIIRNKVKQMRGGKK